MRIAMVLIAVVLAMAMTMGAGCGDGQALTDISGWDLSACWDGWRTCGELFMDNSDRIDGGPEAVVRTMNPFGSN